jgi:hypothetical protein
MTRARITYKTHWRGNGLVRTNHTAWIDGVIVGEWAKSAYGWVGPNWTFTYSFADWRKALVVLYPAEVAA